MKIKEIITSVYRLIFFLIITSYIALKMLVFGDPTPQQEESFEVADRGECVDDEC